MLARGTAFSVYLFVGVLQARRAEVLELAEEVGDGPGGGEDVLGAVLGRWKGEKVDLEEWIRGAEELWEKAPVAELETFGGLSRYSVLRVRGNGLEEGRTLFAQQDKEVKRMKTLMEIRGKAIKLWNDKRVRGALAVGVVAVVLGVCKASGRGDSIGLDVWKFIVRARR